MTPTFVEEHHDLLEGLHEVDVVVAVLLDLQQQAELGQTLGGEGFQQQAVLLRRRNTGLYWSSPTRLVLHHHGNKPLVFYLV